MWGAAKYTSKISDVNLTYNNSNVIGIMFMLTFDWTPTHTFVKFENLSLWQFHYAGRMLGFQILNVTLFGTRMCYAFVFKFLFEYTESSTLYVVCAFASIH